MGWKSFMMLVVVSMSTNLFGGNFEGKIDVTKRTCYDTMYYSYMVKDSIIRIDNFNTNNILTTTLLIDLTKQRIIAIDQLHKQYKDLVFTLKENEQSNKYEIIKTDNTKIINGYKCYQWRVKNREKNSEIAYWVTKDGFYFFNHLMMILGANDNYADFFTQISDNQGYLPIWAVERTLVRFEKQQILITNIEPKKLEKNLFNIPPNYNRCSF